ncbi:MAG: S-layer homology domain-containing protein, partial [Firmicutes bacterium]|nr:S-layer homology domain-containing protein [Bacillota bacterium]
PEDVSYSQYGSYYTDVVLTGYSTGIYAYFNNAAGEVSGKGGNVTLNTEFGNDSSRNRYLEGESCGIMSNGSAYNTPVTGKLIGEGGTMTLNIPADNVRNRAGSTGMSNYNERLVFAGSEFLARGNTKAFEGYSNNVTAGFSSPQILLTNTENKPEGATEATITSGAIPASNGTEDYKYVRILAPSYVAVNVTPGNHMTMDSGSGAASQTVFEGASIEDVIYTADEGYYFPDDYADGISPINGISISSNGEKVTVSGIPATDTSIVLPAATQKEKLPTPAAVFKATGPDSGTLDELESGAYHTEFITAGGQEAWTNFITEEASFTYDNIGPGTLTVVRVPASAAEGAVKQESDPQQIVISRAEKPALTAVQPEEAGATGSIPTTEIHEISTDGTDYEPCTGASEELAEGTYYVRVAAKDNVLASEPQTIKIKYSAPSGGGGGGGIDDETNEITVPDVENGSAAVSPKDAAAGTKVTVTAQPDEGFEADGVEVMDEDGNPVEVKDNGDGTYSFVMPDGPVTVTPKFKPSADHVDYCPAKKFTDVDITQWYHLDLDYVLNKGMMNGTSDTTFEPQSTTNRAMIVTILWRLEGEPKAKESAFTDLTQDWYKAAVGWAAENGIVNGTSATTFAPTDPITREQFAAILYRYADHKKYDVSQKADLNKYTDADSISGYAQDAFGWANAAGLINGMTETTLAPQGNATRAQAAAILHRFCEKVAK